MGIRSLLKARVRARLRYLARPLHIGACLVLLSLCALFLTDLLGFRDDGRSSSAASRKTLAETSALYLSTLVNIGDQGAIDYAVTSLVSRSSDILAVSLSRADGTVLMQSGDDNGLNAVAPVASLSHISVPIFDGKEKWGELRIVFAPLRNIYREIAGLAFFMLSTLVAFTVLLNKAFIQLDPNRAVPSRVDTAFNLFASGVVILDDKMRIVMANSAACEMGAFSREELLGSTLDEWNWEIEGEWQEPWKTTFHTGLLLSDHPLRLTQSDGSIRHVMVSCALVGDGPDGAQGVIVTLDDVSSIERKNKELAATLHELRSSQALIHAKNKELERLATTDALTGIANRRVLIETLALELEQAQENHTALACIMTDIDHFKSVNDTYGHGVGDDVIRAVAGTLAAACEDGEMVGRYGGEEFVMVLPGVDAMGAAERAESVRAAITRLAKGERLAVSRLSSSFGVADLSSGATDVSELIDLADQALYQAKQNGRNRVSVFDRNLLPSDTTGETHGSPPVQIDPPEARLAELEAMLLQREKEIATLREYDALTGVPMRTLFLQRLESELLRARRSKGYVGVLSFEFRELDRLVSTFGHVAVDTLVVSVVERLQQGLLSTDLVTVISAEHSLSRIASNEYGVLLTEITDAAGTMIVITRLKRMLAKPFMMGEQKVYVGMNIGVALSSSESMVASDLFSQASEARLEASTRPDKVSHAFAIASLTDQSQDYIRLESDLRDALNQGKLEVYFQPKFDLAERRVTGMEALVRWNHATRGFVRPDIFVAVAEANGLIEQLSSFVVKETLKQILVWRKLGYGHLVVSVNASPMQLRAESLVNSTLAALKLTGVEGRQLEIELTETSVLDNQEKAIAALNKLRAAGIRISIDDFGTGYTSLSLLSKLPVDIIKIDRTFVIAMKNSDQDRLIVQSMVSMAHTLGLKVVGEGVETNEELEMLAGFGCDQIQGFLISHPLPAKEVTAFLDSQQGLRNVG